MLQAVARVASPWFRSAPSHRQRFLLARKTFSEVTGILTGRLVEDSFKGGTLHEYELQLSLPGAPTSFVRLVGIMLPLVRSWKQLGEVNLRLRPHGFDLSDGEKIPSTGMGGLRWDNLDHRVTVEHMVLSRHPSDELKLELFLELSETTHSRSPGHLAEDMGLIVFELHGTVDIGDVWVSKKSWTSAQTLLRLEDYEQIAKAHGTTLRPSVLNARK